jgi:hypothetical protein
MNSFAERQGALPDSFRIALHKGLGGVGIFRPDVLRTPPAQVFSHLMIRCCQEAVVINGDPDGPIVGTEQGQQDSSSPVRDPPGPILRQHKEWKIAMIRPGVIPWRVY